MYGVVHDGKMLRLMSEAPNFRAVGEGNLELNVLDDERFVLPSGQEIEKEHILSC